MSAPKRVRAFVCPADASVKGKGENVALCSLVCLNSTSTKSACAETSANVLLRQKAEQDASQTPTPAASTRPFTSGKLCLISPTRCLLPKITPSERCTKESSCPACACWKPLSLFPSHGLPPLHFGKKTQPSQHPLGKLSLA